MTHMKMICLAAALTFSATGCTVETDSDISDAHLRRVDAQHVAVSRHNGPEAVVSAGGEISIAGRAVALDPAQKDIAVRYFANANAVRDDGFATGMAGASTALTAISSVVTGLASGEPDKIGTAVDAKAAKVQAQAEKLCRDLGELAATQNALAASVPEFKPYALIQTQEVNECDDG